MEKLIPVHHSVVDWDFQHGPQYRSLSATQYVSAPTSLRFLKPTLGTWRNAVLCRHPDAQCLPQGEVRTWVWAYYTGRCVALFRNQKALGNAAFANTYGLFVTTATATLIRYINSVYSVRDSTTCIGHQNHWDHYRVFWYNGKTPGDVPALCVDVYYESAGEWVKQGDTLYDTANYWKDSGTNRAGFRGYSEANHPQYWDDTEIWGPV